MQIFKVADLEIVEFVKPVTRRGIFVLAGLLAAATVVWSESKEITSSLTLDEVIAEALQNNPQVRAMQAKWEAAQDRPAQERTLPNPTLIAKGGNGLDDFSFPRTQEARVGIEQTFPWFGTLDLRGKVAEKDAAIVHHEHETMELEVVASVKEAYFDLYSAQLSRSITHAEEDVLNEMEAIAESKYSTGAVSQQDVLKAQTEITMLQQQLLELEQQETTAKAKLNLLLNRPADSPLGLAVTPPSMQFETDTGKLFAMAEKERPEIQRAQMEIDRNETQRDLMKKEFFPDYRLGLEYGHMEGGYTDFSGSENQLMVTIGFDLPIWRTKYRAGLHEAEKMVESSQDDLEAAKKQIAYDVQDAHFKSLTAKRTVDLYKNSLIPQAEARFKASETAYRTGQVSFLELLESERFLLDARVMEAMAEGNLGVQLARQERAIGTGVKYVSHADDANK
jgi:cobalt-zinc-cadmium efflux system outer membrane protein